MVKQKSFAVFTLGLQHVLAMYAGAILVPLLVGRALNVTSEQLSYLLAIDLLTCGVATLLQTLRGAYIGIGLPVMLGSSFVAVTPMIAIGANTVFTPFTVQLSRQGYLSFCLRVFSAS